MYLVGFPLLLIPFAIYNIVAFITPGVSWTEPLTRLRFPAGGEWAMSLGDMLVTLAIVLLLVEIIKAYRHGGRYFTDHALSILLLLAACAEFYLVPRATTAAFFILIVASLADVVGGLVAMRRRKPAEALHDEPEAGPAVPDAPPPPPDIAPVTPARAEAKIEPRMESLAAAPSPGVSPPPAAVTTELAKPVLDTPTPDKPVSDKTS